MIVPFVSTPSCVSGLISTCILEMGGSLARKLTKRSLGVLLDTNDGQLNGDTELGMCDVGLLVTQSHGANEALVLDGSPREALTNKGRLGDLRCVSPGTLQIVVEESIPCASKTCSFAFLM